MNKIEILDQEKLKSKVLLNNISNCLNNINYKIDELLKFKNQQDNIIQKFEIKCFNDVLKNAEIQLKNIEKEDFTTIEKLQINAIKKGIYDKFMLEKSEIDRAKFKKKFDKIQNRGAIAKALDVFLEREDIVDMKKENMFFAIKEIDETRNNIDETEEPKKEYKIIEILAEIEIFLRENYNGRNKRKLSQIYKIRDNIYSVFSIDSKELKNEIIEKQKSRLPVKINKRIIVDFYSDITQTLIDFIKGVINENR